MSSSSPMPWVKIYTDFLDDRKIGRLDDVLKLRFIQLILLAGECDADGYLIDGAGFMSASDIAWRLRVDPASLVLEMDELKTNNLLSLDDMGAWLVINFSKRQDRPQAVKRAEWRDRQRIHRDNFKTEAIVTSESPVTHASRGEERREEKRREETVTIPENINTPEFCNAWHDWEIYRKEIKKTLTPTTTQRQLKFLSRYDNATALEMINQSIQAGWTGLFELKNNNHRMPPLEGTYVGE